MLEQALVFIEKNGQDFEGLFRIPGIVSDVQHLREQMEQPFTPHFDQVSLPTVCGAIKTFFRELPEPLLPFDEMVAVASM